MYWKAFYESKNIATIALFASNIIKHSEPNLKMKAQRVFAKITPVLGFKHIQYHHEKNQSCGKNVELMKNIADIKGEKIVELKSKVQSHNHKPKYQPHDHMTACRFTPMILSAPKKLQST